jgi:hypothetical protein
MSMTYVPPTSQFAFVELTAHRLTLVNKNGAFVDSCEPIDIFRPEDMSAGVTYDPIQDTFLTVFENGVVRELFAEFNEGLCTETQFNFRLSSLGENFGEPAAIGGIQISRNTLIVCGRSARALFQVLIFPSGPLFRRGDFNRSGGVDLSDAVATANYLFRSGPAPSCPDAADANDDGLLEISDPVFLLFYLFLQGPAPPEPFPDAGEDPTFRDNLGCEEAV